ncbi:MAG: alpha/beta fold hydrolase [Christensenellales bacterium]
MVLSVDGYSVGYDRADNGGKPLLILHGWGCDAKVMRRVFFYFADKGRDVIAIDFPGSEEVRRRPRRLRFTITPQSPRGFWKYSAFASRTSSRTRSAAEWR